MTKAQLQRENEFLRSKNSQLQNLLQLKRCPSPVNDWLPLPIPPAQKPAVMAWLRDNFTCDHHGDGYFEGLRYCCFEPEGWRRDEFPVPLPDGMQLMVRFSNTDADGTHADAAWYAVKSERGEV
jgi:hypothetical protein